VKQKVTGWGLALTGYCKIVKIQAKCLCDRTDCKGSNRQAGCGMQVPVDMQHHEGLAHTLKLEVHDSWEGSTH